MSGESSAESMPTNRRALLKAAVAGGAFAVPLIASFSMDSASAQTKAEAFGSSNQTIVSNMFVCSNMTGVQTATFYAELSQAFPTAGLAGFGLAAVEFTQGRDQVNYEIAVEGTVVQIDFLASTGDVIVIGGAKDGVIPGGAVICSNGAPNGAGLHQLYEGFAAGQASIRVHLNDHGSHILTGKFSELAAPLHFGTFRTIG
jgi:hypothetical protein